MCENTCKKSYQCRGNCWLNVAGVFDVWEVVSKKCSGTKEEQTLIDNMFNNKIDRKEILNKYDFTEDEKEILAEFWL